ncbi:hypothetical protein LC612_03360, partial [Nostoc sp. CHAB 5834]|nr:hypothetical protein [Nostoc sp. CHAB 5834]
MIWLQANQFSFKNVRSRDFSPDFVPIASRREDFSPHYKTTLQDCDTVAFKLLTNFSRSPTLTLTECGMNAREWRDIVINIFWHSQNILITMSK